MELPSIDREASREGYKKLRDDLREVQARIEGIEETADSPDGLVTATVVGRGKLSELHLDPRIYRSADSKALASSIVDTIAQAVLQAEQKLFSITRQYLPDDAKFEETNVHTGPFMHQLDKEIAGGSR